MMRKLTKSLFLALGLATAQHAGAFVLWGPIEAQQTAAMDYSNPAGSIRFYYYYVEPSLDGIENGGPKYPGYASRLTTPIVTYGFDDTFLAYFGAQGVAAVDSAFQVLNALPTASSANLENFLTEGAVQINYTAQAMGLYDLKSVVLSLMAEHMGLLGETHVWDLTARALYPSVPANPCNYEYYIANFSYDPVTYDPSPYVNGRQYGYDIWDGCNVGVDVGAVEEIPLDTASPRYTAIATQSLQEYGGYYLNFTRDDMGGLRFLYSKTNYAFLALDSNSVVEPFGNSTWEAVNTTNAITGISNFVGLIGGAEKITFVKVNFDSLLNPGFTPVTYHYTVPYVTNFQLSQLSVTRTVTTPDILFTAAFLIANGPPITDFELTRTGTFIPSTYVSPGGGITPSTINPAELIVLNNAGPQYFDYNPSFLDALDYAQYPVFNWGSFDGTTNPPIVFPNGFSLAELEEEVLEGGQEVPVSPWIAVLNPNNTNITTTTGTGAGGVGGAAPVTGNP
jgi:hypothetical protein